MKNTKVFEPDPIERANMFASCILAKDIKQAYIDKAVFLDSNNIWLGNASPAQAEAFYQMMTCTIVYFFMSRQAGKSITEAMCLENLIDSQTASGVILLIAYQVSSLYTIWHENVFSPYYIGEGKTCIINTSSFSASDPVVNYIYRNALSYPGLSSWYNKIVISIVKHQEDMSQKYGSDYASKNPDLLYPTKVLTFIKDGVIVFSSEGIPYVRLLVKKINFNSTDVTAIYYNGIIVKYVGGNAEAIDKACRGGRLICAMCEEVGNLEGSFEGAIMPTLFYFIFLFIS